MNKIIIIGIAVIIGSIIVGYSLYDTSNETIAIDIIDGNLDSAVGKHYSETLTESVNVNTP